MSTTNMEIQISDWLFCIEYDPGCAPITSGPPDNWYPGDPPEIEVVSVQQEIRCSVFIDSTWEQALEAFKEDDGTMTEEKLLEQIGAVAESILMDKMDSDYYDNW